MLKPAKNAMDLGIIVSDISASIEFYHDFIGLEMINQVPLPFGTMHILRFGDSDVKLIDPDEVPPASPSGLTSRLGYRYLTFAVANLTEICMHLKEKGVHFTVPESEIRPGVRIAMVRDPDGNTVEFVQRTAS